MEEEDWRAETGREGGEGAREEGGTEGRGKGVRGEREGKGMEGKREAQGRKGGSEGEGGRGKGVSEREGERRNREEREFRAKGRKGLLIRVGTLN